MMALHGLSKVIRLLSCYISCIGCDWVGGFFMSKSSSPEHRMMGALGCRVWGFGIWI